MIKQGVNSQPKIGTKQPWVGWEKMQGNSPGFEENLKIAV
jgi:hypothetical protein